MKTQWMAIICLIAFVTTSSALQSGDFTYGVTASNTVTITDYTGTASILDIPATIDGKPVTTIGDEAFRYCYSLTSITIPEGVTSVENRAFYSCSSLTSITIPSTVTSIGYWAFFKCSNLTSITIPSSVPSIGDHAFSACTSLTSITIPEGVISIGEYAFNHCDKLTSITIPSSVTSIGYKAFSYCDGRNGVYYRGDVPSIGTNIFNGSTPTIYYLPNTTGWESTFAGRPTALWNPSIQTTNENFGVQSNLFGFDIANGPTNALVQIEASTNLSDDVWTPVVTHTMTNGTVYFSDASYTNHPNRFYRLDMPD